MNYLPCCQGKQWVATCIVNMLLLIGIFALMNYHVANAAEHQDAGKSASTGNVKAAKLEKDNDQEADISVLLDEKHPQVSPGGEYVLEYVRCDTSEARAAMFIVYTNDEAHEVIHESRRVVYVRFNNFIFWDPDPELHRIWVYDGDTGTYFVQRVDNQWKYYIRDHSTNGTEGWYPYLDLDGVRAGNRFGQHSEDERYPDEVEIPELLRQLRPRIFGN